MTPVMVNHGIIQPAKKFLSVTGTPKACIDLFAATSFELSLANQSTPFTEKNCTFVL